MQTTDSTTIPASQARKALEAFLTDNSELECLEGLLAQFNIFEAIGVVRHEVRHSDFLAFLLNPQEKHGLGDAFLKRLLQTSVASAGRADIPVTLIDLDFWNLDTTNVQREWQRIDIFLRDELHQFSVIIENKIDTGEHDEQLARYYERVRREFPKDRILALYLTKEGDDPTDDRYLPISYGAVCRVVENLIEHRASTLSPDVRTLMTHYAQMLRRHILSDTDIARLCRSIYQEHKAALDLIYEHRPNRLAEIGLYLETMVKTAPGLNVGSLSKNNQYLGLNWPKNQHPIFFVFHNFPDSLTLLMQIMPGDQEVRQRLFEFATNHQPPFTVTRQRITQWTNIFSRRFLTASDYEESDNQELENKIRDCWEQFLLHDLPAIRQVMAEGGWLSTSEEPEQQPFAAFDVS